MPYLLNRLTVGPGLAHEVGYPKEPTQMSPWAVRLMKSHENSLANLTVFAPLVIAAHLAGVNNEFTAVAAVVYLWARVGFVLAYALAIPWVRTIGFQTGVLCQLASAGSILTA